MKRWYGMFFVLILAAVLVQGSERAMQEQEILSMMKPQVEEWNRGNCEGFMAPYWNSAELTFQSGNTRRYGWKNLLKMYKTNYAGEKRGILNFTDLKVKFLGEDLAYALGRWHVKTGKGADAKEKEGLFTLILRKYPSGWVIIHDHSS